MGQSESMGGSEKKEMDEVLKGAIDRVAYGILLDKGMGRSQDIDLQSHAAAADSAEKKRVYDALWEIVEENRQLLMGEMPGSGGDMAPIENVLHRLVAKKLAEAEKGN